MSFDVESGSIKSKRIESIHKLEGIQKVIISRKIHLFIIFECHQTLITKVSFLVA